MIARRRRVGVFVPDVPEYLVDDSSIGDERDNPHGPAAAGTQQQIFLPDLPNELRPSYALLEMGSPREAELFAQFYRRIMPADVVEDAVGRLRGFLLENTGHENAGIMLGIPSRE